MNLGTILNFGNLRTSVLSADAVAKLKIASVERVTLDAGTIQSMSLGTILNFGNLRMSALSADAVAKLKIASVERVTLDAGMIQDW